MIQFIVLNLLIFSIASVVFIYFVAGLVYAVLVVSIAIALIGAFRDTSI